MQDVIQTILDTEGRYADEVEKARAQMDALVGRRLEEIENEKREEKKRITEEHRQRYRSAIEMAARQIEDERAMTGRELERLNENEDMAREVREKIVSILFNK